ncbi:MAG: tetratricopeptide repeat protein [Ignavibacteriae bacterium]|nr:tetratricopeptide repeat protein [Ignavibacteriota bacterium]MCB9206186.1 tetratricopeptide repeat protein [Ignavibacteriales bacterium]MCB9210826.1 tetratricopeptide repeat protein [Ignavibacteriales bacterium]MCB9217878.1 tetratricopeptide repeat protein [Ignavibacteriales bacterium]
MIGKKKKLTKKELQEDKLVTSFYKSQEFFDEYKQKLIIIAGSLAVIVLAILWYVNKKSDDNLKAASQLSEIVSYFDMGQYQKAIDGEPGTQLIGLNNIVDNYGSTEQGEIAKIYLAKSYYALGNYDQALEYYSDYSGDSKLHQSSAFAGMAACYEQKGQFEDAADLYKKAANTYDLKSQKSEYLLNSGINYIKAGNKEEAKDLLETLKNDFKTTVAAREVEKYLSQL